MAEEKPMDYPTFGDLQAHIQSLYQEGDYAGALKLATEQMDRFPEEAHLLFYWRICMAARTEQIRLVYQLLDNLLDSGFWYGETLLRKSPSLLPLQGLPEFEARLERNSLLQAIDQKQLFPLITLRSSGRCSLGEEPCPLLFALHENASTATASAIFWQEAASNGWLVAIPQSTQAIWKNAYVWNERDQAVPELIRHYHSLTGQYALDLQRTVIAGHSMGGEMAIWLAIKNLLPANGFIALGPGGGLIDEVENWTALLRENPARNLRGYLVFGQEDTSIPHENIRILAEILNEAGIPTELEEIPDVGHEYSIEYSQALVRGLNFIEED